MTADKRYMCSKVFLKIATRLLPMSVIDDAVKPFKESWSFFFSKPVEVLSDITKVAILALALQIIFSLGMELLATSMGIDINAENPELPMAFIAISIVIAIPVIIINAALNATPYSLVDERANGRSGKIVEKSIELLLPIGKYILTVLLVFVSILIVSAILSIVLSAVDPLIGIGPLVAAALAIVLLVFAIQLAIPEIVLRGAGTVEAMKRSWELATKNAATVLLFDILLIILIVVSSLLLSILMLPVASFSSMSAIAGQTYGTLVTLVNGVVLTMITILSFYFFWKQLTEEPKPEVAPEPVKARQPAKKKRSRKKR